jgi:polyisoprenoid-binding protein YceI
MKLFDAPRPFSLAIVAMIAVGCGGAASFTASPTTAAATASPTTAPATPTAVTALTWTVSDKSKVTIRVREQLASLNFPSDAVLVGTGAKGGFGVNADGTFATGSQISFDVTSLTSDSSQRDNFVKQSVLATRQFPTATFVPTKAIGLTLPLAANAHVTFKLTGKLTIHGTEKEVTFSVDATRSGGELTATATLDPTVRFGDFGMPQPAAPGRVLSVVDEIKMTVDLVATGPAS